MKSHATERGHAFTLTYAYWEKFCAETNYHLLKGREPNSFTIDRKDETQGYHDGNIRILTHSQNVRRNYVPYFKNNGIKVDAKVLEESWKPNTEDDF